MRRPPHVSPDLHLPFWAWLVLAGMTALLLLPWAIWGYVRYWDWIFGWGAAGAFWLPIHR